ncbi:hypothetical protein CJU90_1988 [Yarrowia sp. C11]|nr:hypothetical protein CKK34_6016 [Yarrowia sp. E02]KAG5371920.1 hypothetical protein CJU90_1988 [Yarrowia sp. C11]
MKTTRPNMHINLHSPNPQSCGGAALGRTLSNTSQSSLPSTPMDQTIHTPHGYLSRNNSITSSVATSEDEDGYMSDLNSNPLTSVSNQFWPKEDDQFLMDIYHKVVDNPTIAPFVGHTPPSGIIHRVAKDCAKRSKAESRDFPHSMVAIRRRLLVLTQRGGAANQTAAKDNAYDGPGTLLFGAHVSSADHVAEDGQHNVDFNSDWLQDDDTMDTSMDSNHPLTPPTLSRPTRITLSHQSPVFSMDTLPLDSPFQEGFSFKVTGKRLAESPMMGDVHDNGKEEDVEGLPTNITSQRKRDSLRFKRGQQKK